MKDHNMPEHNMPNPQKYEAGIIIIGGSIAGITLALELST